MDVIILFLNILGTFFVSVEAIKIENLQKLTLILRKSKSKLNPKIEIVDDDKTLPLKEKFGCHIFSLIVLIIFGPISFILLQTLFPSLHISWLLSLTFFSAIIIWTLLIYLIEILIELLTVIETYTSKGFIGISGFIILTIGFILQYHNSNTCSQF